MEPTSCNTEKGQAPAVFTVNRLVVVSAEPALTDTSSPSKTRMYDVSELVSLSLIVCPLVTEISSS